MSPGRGTYVTYIKHSKKHIAIAKWPPKWRYCIHTLFWIISCCDLWPL